MVNSVRQKRKLRNARKKRKRTERAFVRYKVREVEVQERVHATVQMIRKDFEQQKRIASKYYEKWKLCMLNLKKVKKNKAVEVNVPNLTTEIPQILR